MLYFFINLFCFIGLGLLVAGQFVRYIEYSKNRNKPSYKKYMVNFILRFLLVFGLIYIMAITEGEETECWVLSLLPLISAVLTIVLTVKVLFKKKGMSFLNKEEKEG